VFKLGLISQGAEALVYIGAVLFHERLVLLVRMCHHIFDRTAHLQHIIGLFVYGLPVRLKSLKKLCHATLQFGMVGADLFKLCV